MNSNIVLNTILLLLIVVLGLNVYNTYHLEKIYKKETYNMVDMTSLQQNFENQSPYILEPYYHNNIQQSQNNIPYHQSQNNIPYYQSQNRSPRNI